MAYNRNETREELVEVQKNNRGEYIKAAKIINNNSGSENIDLRLFYTNEEDAVCPTTKGVRFNSELLLDVLKGMAKGLEMDEVIQLRDTLDEMIDSEDDSAESDN